MKYIKHFKKEWVFLYIDLDLFVGWWRIHYFIHFTIISNQEAPSPFFSGDWQAWAQLEEISSQNVAVEIGAGNTASQWMVGSKKMWNSQWDNNSMLHLSCMEVDSEFDLTTIMPLYSQTQMNKLLLCVNSITIHLFNYYRRLECTKNQYNVKINAHHTTVNLRLIVSSIWCWLKVVEF